MAEQELGTDPGEGIIGHGTTVEGEDTGPIGMLTKISLEGVETDEVDVTTMNSVDKWKQFIAGLKDARNINLELVYHKRNAGILQAAVGGPNETWTITLPDGSTYVQDGYIRRVGMEIPFGDKITQTATLRMSGAPVFNEASDSA